MALKDKLKGIKYLRWVKSTDDSFSFRPQEIYPLLRVEGDNDLVVKDETEEEIYVEPEDLQFFVPVTDEEYRDSLKQLRSRPQQISTNSSVSTPQAITTHTVSTAPSIVSLELEQIPHWALYLTISNEGIFATSESIDEVSKMKEKVSLTSPIILKIPKRKIPLETLAMWFKEGKITYEEFEKEMKSTFGGLTL